MYGVLSPDLTVQSIRVYPHEDFPTLGSPLPLDVDVRSIDLETDERVIWQDSIIVEPNGQNEHVFWAPFRAEFGHRYRVEVIRRKDGARSFADVSVPDSVTVSIVDDSDASAVQVQIEGGGSRVLKPEVVYVLPNVRSGCEVLSNRFSYEGKERAVEDGWRFNINMVVDRRSIFFGCDGQTIFPPPYCPPYMGLSSLELHLLIGDPAWDPPGGIFDPDILSEPHTMTNVVNGFGFVGAGYRVVVDVFPAREAVEHACFEYR